MTSNNPQHVEPGFYWYRRRDSKWTIVEARKSLGLGAKLEWAGLGGILEPDVFEERLGPRIKEPTF